MLGRIAASYEVDPARQQDLLQEMSLGIWRALRTWRGEASLKTFIARIAQNHGADHVSRHAGRQSMELTELHVDEQANPEASAVADQRRACLVAAVRRLSVGKRQVVVLSLEGFSQREIADVLGLEENTVNQRLTRARKQLRVWLEKET